MLLYVLPFVLLLVIAIVLKKKEDANKESTSASTKKNNNKKTAKKNVARTARTSQRPQTSVVEDPVVIKQETKPLSADLKKSIEKLIAEKNYFSAEAKINQALNQDNSQHELYLYLLDVHLAQKDEFAVNQLINHIRSLGLDDIVAQAEEHQKAAQAETPIESIAFTSSTPVAPEAKNTAAFDALIGNTEATAEPVKSEAQPLVNDTLEFSAPTIHETTKESPQAPVQPLEFNLEPAPKESTPSTEFSFEATPPAEETKSEAIIPLEFSFTPSEPATPVEKPTEVEIASEFKLDFSETTPVVEEQKPVADLEFKLTPSETDTQPAFSFELETKPEVVEQETVVAPAFNLETPSQTTANVSVDANDPLVKSFPELAEVNEIELNLDLAEQYISLGAFSSARELLAQDDAKYTAEQRQQSQNLLNQIAS